MTPSLPDPARFRLLVENIGDVLWFKELYPPRFSYVSPAFERIWGFGVDELQKRPGLWEERIHPEDRKAVREALKQWFDGSKADYVAHYRIIGCDGQVRWLADRGIILGRKDGKPYQIGGIARDITEREVAEAARKRLAAVVESSDDAIITLDLNGVIQTWNAGAERIFQYTAQEAVGKPVSFLRPPEAADDEAVFRRYIRRGKRIDHYETRRIRKDGRVIDISLSISPLMDAGGHLSGFSKISRDITQQNVGRRMFDRLLEAAPDGFVILDGQGRVWLANARAESLFGIPRKTMTGKRFEILLALRERQHFGELRNDFLANPESAERFRGMELAGLRKNGSEFPMEISLSQVETPEGQLIIIDITDITSRKEAEQTIRRLNAELEQRVEERTAALTEQIAARLRLEEELLNISEREQRRIGQDLHDDLGQQLAGAWMMADVLQRTLEAAKSPQYVAAKKMGELLQKALAHTRGLARGLHPVAPEQGGFARALENLATQSSELFGVQCHFECRDDVLIEGEAAMVHYYRIAQEAVSNAVKHGRARRIRIGLTQTTLTITDDGLGLQNPVKTEGMGMRIMRYRAEITGGTLKVENGRRKGVVVTCQFPSVPDYAKKSNPDPTPKKRVLIVDDHPIFRAGLTGLVNLEADLIVCGEAHDATQALAALEDLKPDLTLMDMSLPDKSGLELLKDMRAISPQTSVLIISMHDETLYAERVIRAGGRGYIMKQEGPGKIIHAIRKVLSGGVAVSERMAALILDALSGSKGGGASVSLLSDREFEVYQLLGRGKDPHEIAGMLHLSIKTVDTHRIHIRQKLGLRNATELIHHATRWAAEQA